MKVDLIIWSHWRNEVWEGTVEVAPSHNPIAINEELYRLFNRVDEADIERLEKWGYNLPSLSVEDRLTWGGKTWEVRFTGFREVVA